MRRLIHLALAAAGLALLIWGLVFNPAINCRGVAMHAGDVCVENDLSKLGSAQEQTYEQRLRAMRQSQPVLVGLGALVLAFGIGLFVQDRRFAQDRRSPAARYPGNDGSQPAGPAE